MYEFLYDQLFKRKYKRLTKKNPHIKDLVKKSLQKLSNNPFDLSLHTHKVSSRVRPNVYSSKVNGDIRIIWDFSDESVNIIDLYDIGGHSGVNKVYK